MAAVFPQDEVKVNSLENDLFKILTKLDQSYWKDKKLVLDRSHGNFNKNFIIHAENDPTSRQFVRLFNPKMEFYLRHNQRNYVFLNNQKLSAPIHCLFKNGCLMEVVQGTPITLETSTKLLEPDVQKAVAEELARYHSDKMLDEAFKAGFERGIGWHEEVWFRQLFPVPSNDAVVVEPTVDQVLDELRMLDEELQRRCSPLALCHGDTNASNIVYHEDTKTVTFVDYDTVCVAHAVFDISVYFCTIIDPFDIQRQPSENYQNVFLMHYITKKNQLNGKRTSDIEKDLMRLKEDLKVGNLIVTLHLLSCFVTLADGVLSDPEKPLDPNWLKKMVTEHWEYYIEQKKRILG